MTQFCARNCNGMNATAAKKVISNTKTMESERE
jgi:hypothetical protein